MKIRFSILFSLFFFVSSNVIAQRVLKNAVVDFSVSVAKLETSMHEVPDSFFVPARLSYTHYFSSNSFLLENTDQDTTIRIRHHRSKNGQGSYFFNLRDQAYKIDQLTENKYKGSKSTDRLAVKEILGYNCHKETFYISDSNFIVMYVTKNLKPGFNYYHQIFPNLKGFPLEMIIHRDGQVYKYTANSIKMLPEKYPLLPDLQQYKLLKEGKLKKKLMSLISA